MKNLKLFVQLFLLVTLFVSCEEDSTSYDNQIEVEAVTIYEQYKTSINKMEREYFVGLSKDIQMLAYDEFTNEKKMQWWIQKLEESKNIEFLTKKQINILNKIQEEVKKINFSTNYDNTISLNEIKKFIEEAKFDTVISKNIFESIAPINKKGHLINQNSTNILLSSDTSKIYEFSSYEANTQTRINFCNAGGCFWCSPAYSDCNDKCVERSGFCGILLLESCDRRCFNN